MDPDANLVLQIALAEMLAEQLTSEEAPLTSIEVQALRLAELVLALHGWLRTGGFPPSTWKPAGRVLDIAED